MEIIVSIINRNYVNNQILNLTTALIEESDILKNIYMSQLMTVQVLQGNNPTEQIQRKLFLPGV